MNAGETDEQRKKDWNGKQTSLNQMYCGDAQVSVRGPVSDSLYQFSRQQPVQAVDARDAVSMLKTRLFRRIK